MGIGGLMVGKHVGRMVSALGGRLAAFRDAGGGAFDEPVVRNIFHESPPSDEAVRFVSARLGDFRDGLAAMPAARLLPGADRKGCGAGKSVSGSVVIVGRRIIKKKNKR